jgi:hypothetical protein
MKNELLEMLDKEADQNTKSCLESLNDREIQKLWIEIHEFRKELPGVAPVITVKELRRTKDVVTWKLSCRYEVHSSTQL